MKELVALLNSESVAVTFTEIIPLLPLIGEIVSVDS